MGVKRNGWGVNRIALKLRVIDDRKKKKQRERERESSQVRLSDATVRDSFGIRLDTSLNRNRNPSKPCI